jgi:hypothetical protein
LRGARPPMPDDENPPGRRLVLKPKEVERTDSVARPGDGTEISVRLIHLQNKVAEERSSLGHWDGLPRSPADGADEPGRSPLLGFKEVTPTDPFARPGDGTAVSVALIHRQNRLAAEKRGMEIVAMPPRRRSRRTRDFILIMAAAGSAVTVIMLQLPRTRGTLIMGLIILAYVAAVFAWLMFGVMDDY